MPAVHLCATVDGLHPAVVPAILRAGFPVTVHPIDPGDRTAYARTLCMIWAAENHLIVMEHDVVISGNILSELVGCPEPWCVVPYDGSHMLGLAKFLPPVTLTTIRAQVIGTDWVMVCEALADRLHYVGHREHVHDHAGRVQHENPKYAQSSAGRAKVETVGS